MAVVAVVAAPVVWAQPLEFESIDPPAQKKRSPALKQRSPQARSDAGQSGQGQVYTYADGDRTVRVRLQADLEVSGDGSVARSSGEHIVTKDSVGGRGARAVGSQCSGPSRLAP